VRDQKLVLNGCSRGREQPKFLVETATIHDFDEHFPVRRIEEPEEARVIGTQRYYLALTAVALEILPVDSYLKATAAQAHLRASRHTVALGDKTREVSQKIFALLQTVSLATSLQGQG